MSFLPPEITPYLKYLAPPVVGGFIGYLTNRIAIRMLFRPLKAWKVAGLRIPMTPGVIPSKRFELAGNMGEVVGDHLLTSEEVGKGLQHESFQNHLYNLIINRVDNILHKDLGPVSSLIPLKFHAYLDIGSKAVTYQIKGQLRGFISSMEFEQIIDKAIDTRLEQFLGKDLGSLLPGDKREVAYNFIEDNITRMFKSQAMEQWLEDFVHQKVYSVLQQEKSLGDILPVSLQELLLDTIEKQVPAFLKKLATLVSDPGVRDKVVSGACTGVEKFVDSLGTMADMVRGFLRMEMVEEKVREYLVEKNDDIVAWLQSEEVQQKVVTVLREKSVDFLEKPIVQWVRAEDEGVVEDFCMQVKKQILLLAQEKEVPAMLTSMIKTNLENHIQSGDVAIGEIVKRLVGDQKTEAGNTWVKNEVRNLIQSENTLDTIDSMVDSLMTSLLNRKIGKLDNIVPGGVKEGISISLQKMASAMLASEVPGLVESLNIRKIVTEKINSLDLLRLERLLLSIMEEQFKYINLFGALLGFLIGCINILFLYG